MDPIASTSAPPLIASPSVVDKGAEAPPKTKSALKREARRQAQLDARPARRALEKEKKKAKKLEKRKLEEEEGAGGEEREQRVIKKFKKVQEGAARVVIDLGFDEKMNDKEIKSMNTQLSYCHSVNRKSENPLHLLYSSFNGRLKSRMDNFGKTHENWKGVEWWEEGYEKLWEGFASETAANEEEVEGGVETNAVASSSKILIGHEAGKPRAASIKSDVIYLTGDSPNILTSFEAGKTYILGGIVDHNRYKLLCYDKAVAQGLAHAALPIAEYLPELKTRYILTVNQVFEIIIKYIELQDWGAAFRAVMPARKFKIDENDQPKANETEGSSNRDDSVIIDFDEPYDADAAEEQEVDQVNDTAEQKEVVELKS